VDELFVRGSAVLADGAEQQLAPVVALLERSTDPATVRVDSFTDSIGPEAFNLDLSTRRAEAVADELRRLHPDPRPSVTVRGHGEADPATSNGTSQGRADNRRIQVVVTA
jgi:outer membrane protein OmpA-like peptidoglycan-associated protein